MTELKFAICLYTHSDCKDVWPITFDSLIDHFPDIKKYVFVNDNKEHQIPGSFEIVTYDNKEIYRKRVSSCLKQIEEDLVLFLHEDMFLLGEPNNDALREIVEYWFWEFPIDSVKLLKGGYSSDDEKMMKNNGEKSSWLNILRHSHCDNYVFAIQPTVWDREALIDICDCAGGTTIWAFENNAQYYVRKEELSTFYVYDNDAKRGSLHWDSRHFPFIATAIVKGKWNTSEYPELTKILQKYNIDPSIRGER